MKVKYVGEYYKVRFQKDKTYTVVGVEDGWYRIVDESDDDGLFSPSEFEIVEQ